MFPCEFHVDSMWNHLESMGEGKVLLIMPTILILLPNVYLPKKLPRNLLTIP
jgi:hypothetical protein